MIKKIINLIVAALLLSSCSNATSGHAGQAVINVLKVENNFHDEHKDQATDSDITEDDGEAEEKREVSDIVEENEDNIVEQPEISEEEPVINIPDQPIENVVDDEDNQQKEENSTMNMIMTIGDRSFNCTLYENETTRALLEQLPLTITMSELNGNEKYYYLDQSLPTNASRPNKLHNGEIMLFGTDCLVLFYEDFSSSYSYTSIGYVNDASQLKDVVGKGSIQVTFAIQ